MGKGRDASGGGGGAAGESLPGRAPPRPAPWAWPRRQKGRSAPPPFCGESAEPAAACCLLQPSPEEPPPPAAMLSARVAAALARSLPRQAGLVSALCPPRSERASGRGGEGHDDGRRRHLGGRGDIEGPRPSATGECGTGCGCGAYLSAG